MRLWSGMHQDKMNALQRSSDAINIAVEYMQSMRIGDIRQTLDFLGVHHTEVIVGLCMFVLMQFTKFTGVLLLAIAIAFGIFYMWDTYFPELSQRRSVSRITDPYPSIIGPSVQDVRTSARLPPFFNTSSNTSEQEFISGGQTPVRVNKGTAVYTTVSSGSSSPLYNRNITLPVVAPRTVHNRGAGISGANTPLAHFGSLASQAVSRNGGTGNLFEERPLYRERRNSDNRSGRNSGQHAMYQDDNRSRRFRGSSIDEERPSRNRRNSKDRPSSARRHSNEQNENARGYDRRTYTTAAGPSSNSNRSTTSSGNYFTKSAQYSISSHYSERENQHPKNQRSPNQTGNNSPNRHRSSRRNSKQ